MAKTSITITCGCGELHTTDIRVAEEHADATGHTISFHGMIKSTTTHIHVDRQFRPNAYNAKLVAKNIHIHQKESSKPTPVISKPVVQPQAPVSADIDIDPYEDSRSIKDKLKLIRSM